MTVEIVFETHSITTDNERGIASGWNDVRLSAKGRDLAAALGRRRRNDCSRVFASDLARAAETARIAFAGARTPLSFDRRLRECNYGDLNGHPASELAPRSRFIDVPFPNGESYRDVVARVDPFLADLGAFDGERVLVIGHSATRWALEVLLNGARLEDLVDAPVEWREGWEFRYSPERGSSSP